MEPNIQKEHAIEAFKSLAQISIEGLKLLALFNGGALVALLAYLGSLAETDKSSPDMLFPMIGYVIGLFCCGLAFMASYLTQLRLYQEAMGRAHDGHHVFWLNTAILSALLSLIAFVVASLLAALGFE